MVEYKPLIEGERKEIQNSVCEPGLLVKWLRRYEATVAALEAELDGCRSGSAMWEDSARYESKKRADAEAEVERLQGALAEANDNYGVALDGACYEIKQRQEAEAEVARLTLLAATGEAVEGMPDGWALHKVRGKFYAGAMTTEGVHGAVRPTAKEALEDAALRAAKGET